MSVMEDDCQGSSLPWRINLLSSARMFLMGLRKVVHLCVIICWIQSTGKVFRIQIHISIFGYIYLLGKRWGWIWGFFVESIFSNYFVELYAYCVIKVFLWLKINICYLMHQIFINILTSLKNKIPVIVRVCAKKKDYLFNSFWTKYWRKDGEKQST